MALEIDRVREVAERVAASMGLEVVDVDFRGGGKARMLRITIDKPEGVTHEDCANVSRDVGTILDVEDVVPGGSYLLEVSSPGLDRKLSRASEFERFAGSLIKVTTREPINGNRHFEGRIESFRDGRITLALGGHKPAKGAKGKKHQEPQSEAPRLEIELANVEKANLVPEI
jgi:ribosome maturation factor RimP